MGRPLSRKYFGSQNAADAADPTQDGEDIHGNGVTNNAFPKLNENAWNFPVFAAYIPGGAPTGGDDEPNADLYIVAQKGPNRFKVKTNDGIGVCKLVDDDGSTTLDEGQMVISGYIDPFVAGDSANYGSGTRINLKKINGSKAYDFSGNQYRWYVENDSSRNVLILNPL